MVASGGAVTDSKWHVVFSSTSQASASVQPCAHHSLLHHPGIILTQTPQQLTAAQEKKQNKGKKNMSHQFKLASLGRDCDLFSFLGFFKRFFSKYVRSAFVSNYGHQTSVNKDRTGG